MSDFFQVKCPKCLQGLKVRTASRGGVVGCPKCHAKFRLPVAKSAHSGAGQRPAKSTKKHRSAATNKIPLSGVAGMEVPAAKAADSQTLASPQPPVARRGAASANPFDIELPAPMAPQGVGGKANGGPVSRLKPPADLHQEIAKQLSQELPIRHVSIAYRMGLLITAVLVLMLPVAYTAVVGASCYGMFYYVTEVLPGLMSNLPRGRAAVIAVLIYLVPIVIGCTVLIFMIKPLFIALIPSRNSRQRFIRRESAPVLFELVDRICEVTGAPKPSRIQVDCDVNASASYGRGLVSLFSNDLVLTIGMPLVEGLSAKQLAGVLAHEFGHFSQGAGMRTSYIIRSINLWFARVVYQRDEVDETLEAWIHDSDFRIAIVLLIAQIFVWITRAILWVFMMVSHTASSFLLRQMEFDADRYEVQISGSRCFEETCRELRLLGEGQTRAMLGLIKLINSAVLVDHLPKMIRVARDQLTLNERKKIRRQQDEEKTGLFDSHPSDTQRIAAAKKQGLDGLLTIDAPATALFANYPALSTGVTQDFYRNQLGKLVNPNDLEPIEAHMDKAFG